MANAPADIKLFGKWAFDDVEVRLGGGSYSLAHGAVLSSTSHMNTG